jgi:hypothetical protein
MAQNKGAAKLKLVFTPKPHVHKFVDRGPFAKKCKCGAVLLAPIKLKPFGF